MMRALLRGLVRGYRAEDAETIVVALGSVVGSLEETVDAMRHRGVRIGLLSIRSFRPFPLAAVRAALGHAKRVVVLEKSFAVGLGGVVSSDVRMALSGIHLHGYTVVAGLGGRAITQTSLERMLGDAVHDKLAQRARRKGIPNQGRAMADFPLLGKLFWHDGREYTAFESSPRGKKHYRYYIGPATAQEKAADQPPFTFSTDEIHQMVIHHLRTQVRDPSAWLPALLQLAGSDSGLNDTRIRQALIGLDEVWGLLADITVADILFQLIKQVTLQPDGARIEVNMEYLYGEVVSFDKVGQAR